MLPLVVAVIVVGLAFALRARFENSAKARRRRASMRSGAQALVVRRLRSITVAARESSLAVLAALDREARAVVAVLDVTLVFTPDGEELACVYSSGSRGDYFHGLRLSRADENALPARAARLGTHLVLDDESARMLPGDLGAIAIPMCDDAGRFHGVVYFAAHADELDAIDELATMVDFAAAAYALACERESDRASATYDALTGLYAPRAFRQLIAHEIATQCREEPCSLWFIDTDRFKLVNDTLGHAMGDHVLQQMANVLRCCTMASDAIVARNGGDEFCVFLRRTRKSDAFMQAQAYCDAVRAHDFGVGMALSASIGVATYPHDARTANELLEVADAAMYHSKRGGRDRVCFAVEPGRFETVALAYRASEPAAERETPERCSHSGPAVLALHS